MTATCATGCGRPSPETTICSQCAWELERDLGDVGAVGQHLSAELDVALSRQVRIGGGSGGRRSAEKPLPYDATSSEALAVLRSTLVGWVREIVDDSPWPADRLDSMAGWLLARMPVLVVHKAADEAFEEIGSAVANARRAVDRPVSRVFAGVCANVPTQDGVTVGPPCDGRVYGRPGRSVALCEKCRHSHDVEARRQEMLDELDDRLFTAAEIATLGVYLGDAFDRARTRKLINAWASRGLLDVRGLSAAGDPRYRFGDVIERLYASLRRTA